MARVPDATPYGHRQKGRCPYETPSAPCGQRPRPYARPAAKPDKPPAPAPTTDAPIHHRRARVRLRVAGTLGSSRKAAEEISQLRSGWWLWPKCSLSRRDGGKRRILPPSLRDERGWWADSPDPSCLANFRLSLRDDEPASGSSDSVPATFNRTRRAQAPLQKGGSRLSSEH